MEIYLIRHTTPTIEKGICYGQTDLDITAEFEIKASKILNEITVDTTTKVYSSPLQRCTKLALKFSKNIITDDRLMELNFGDWELKKWNDIPRNEIDPWFKDFVNVTIPNGEAYIDLYKRANGIFQEIASKNFKKTIITTHGGVIRSIIANLNGVPLANSFDIKVEYGQIFKIVKKNNTFTLL